MMYVVVLEKLSSVRNSRQKLFCCGVGKLKKRENIQLSTYATPSGDIYKIEIAILQNFSTPPNRKGALIRIWGRVTLEALTSMDS